MTTTLQESVASTVAAAFPFSVDKLPLYGPENLPTPHYGLFKSDDGKCLRTAVKQGYVPHSIDDVAAMAEAGALAFGNGLDAKVKCSWGGNGHRVVIEPSDTFRRSVFRSTDNIFPRLIIKADFGRSFTATCGMYRDLCDNLMMTSSVQKVTFKVRHTSSLRTKMDELISDFKQVGDRFDNVYELAVNLEQRRTNVLDFVARLYPVDDAASERAIEASKRRAKKIFQRLVSERERAGRDDSMSDEGSVWEITQAVLG